MEHRFLELRVTVRTDMPNAVRVDAFPAELRQVFTNLITNAAEASSPGGEVCIRLNEVSAAVNEAGQPTPPGAQITVSDNGAGIPEEIRQQLFQPFFTTKGEHGTGLGLWVSRGIINKHGGSIEITSDMSKQAHGSVVTVFLAAKPVIVAETVASA
jgi:signal transduction histidine kinase